MGYNLIEEPIIRVEQASGARETLTLPQVYGALIADQIAYYPALRPHQVFAWHAFLVQVAAMGLEALEQNEPLGNDEIAWTEVLRALIPDWPNDEPWSLVTPPEHPALLQAPIPKAGFPEYEKEFKNEISTPDALDMLVTAKNHDLKGSRMAHSLPDDWLFALVSLQTQEGVMGSGKYGIARMNGGYGSRSYIALRPAKASVGAAFQRDLTVVVENRDVLWDAAQTHGLATQQAIPLLWTESWSGGDQSLPLSRLHPLFVEVCRRVRLETRDGHLCARTAGSQRARVAASHLNGDLGDPWTPVELSDPPKSLSITSEGFSYRRLSELMFGSARRAYRLPVLAEPSGRERTSSAQLVAASIARGQGKTEGFHNRVVDIPLKAISLLADDSQGVARRAQERIRRASDAQGKCLRSALIVLLQKGPADPEWNKPSNASLTEPWLVRFDRRVDQCFFPELWRSLDMGEEDANHAWENTLANIARETLEAAGEATPRLDERRIMAQARAMNMLEGALYKHLPNLRREKEAVEADDESQ